MSSIIENRFFRVVAACAVAGLFHPAFALDSLPVPPSLNPGDPYHLAFVTSTTRDATSSDMSDYNDFVQATADAAGIGSSVGVDWFAIASTPSVHARDNAIVGTTTPVFLLDGTTKIADGFSDIWDGTIDFPLNLNEVLLPHDFVVWTGSLSTGFSDFPLGGELVAFGNSVVMTSAWIHFDGTPSTSSLLPLYALSSSLVVPVPSAFGLWMVGFTGLVIQQQRRRRRD